jgi:hypothetical protein
MSAQGHKRISKHAEQLALGNAHCLQRNNAMRVLAIKRY